MNTYKVTYVFSGNTDKVGWTENWWTTAADASTAITTMQSYVTKRVKLLLSTYAITFMRVTNVDPGRDSFISPISNGAGTLNIATNPSAGVWDCLLCRRDVAGQSMIGHMFMHGVPASIFNGRDYSTSGTPPATWIIDMNAFIVEVQSVQYLLRQSSAAGPFLYKQCTSFAPMRRTSRKLGRPFDALRGRRSVA